MHYLHAKGIGNHGGKYVDDNNLTRQFTYIDHDKKTKVGLSSATPFNFEWERLEKVCLGHPIFDKFLVDNELEWEVNVNLGHLRTVAALIEQEEA